MVRTIAVKWYEHVLQKQGNILKETLTFEVIGRMVRSKVIWKNQIKALMKDIGLTKKDG